MADEITIAQSLTATKTGSGSVSTPRIAFQASMVGSNLVGGLTQDVGTSEETVGFGDISGAPAWVVIKNLDATNFVQLGASGFAGFTIKLKAGQSASFATALTPLYAKADTASVRIQIWAG